MTAPKGSVASRVGLENPELFHRVRGACCPFVAPDVDLDDHAARIVITVLNAKRQRRKKVS